MTHKVIGNSATPGLLPEHHNPPYSIPGVTMPHWETHDNAVSADLHKSVYDYLLNCTWAQQWSGLASELQLFKPGDWNDSWVNTAVMHRTVGQPRTMFGSDEHSTKQKIFAFFIMFKKLVEIRILLVMHAAQVNNVG